MSRKVRQCVVLLVAIFALFFIVTALLNQHFSHAPLNEGDQWRFAHRPAGWNLITEIQRYPLFCREEPDLEGLAGHEDPFVRAAAALAIGREAQSDHIRLLTLLLDDDFEFTRKCALWALMQLRSPSIREPLFRVLGSWEYLVDENGSVLSSSNSGLVSFFRAIGLPTKLLDMPLRERQAWLKTPEAIEWVPTSEISEQAIGMVSAGGYISFEESVWNAGENVQMRLGLNRSSSSNSQRTHISGRGDWSGVNMAGRFSGRNQQAQRRIVKGELLEFDPNGFVLTEQSLTSEVPLSPGIYLFYFRGSMPGGSLHIARVQRSEEAEESIPDMLNKLADSNDLKLSRTVYSMGEHRVKAAIPKLIELFRESGAKPENPHNFAIAEAFSKIGDPRAIPHLLEFPLIINLDLAGNTSKALKSFGPPAYPYCEQRILAWRDTVDQYQASLKPRPIEIRQRTHSEKMRPVLALEMSLRILGDAGSDEVDRVRLELIRELASDSKELTQGEFSPVLVVLRTAVLAIANKHPDDVIEALWVTRVNPDVTQGILSELRRPGVSGARQVCLALWERLQEEPGRYPKIESYMRDKVLRQVAPDFTP